MKVESSVLVTFIKKLNWQVAKEKFPFIISCVNKTELTNNFTVSFVSEIYMPTAKPIKWCPFRNIWAINMILVNNLGKYHTYICTVCVCVFLYVRYYISFTLFYRTVCTAFLPEREGIEPFILDCSSPELLIICEYYIVLLFQYDIFLQSLNLGWDVCYFYLLYMVLLCQLR